jgi:hypothetical protein
VKQQFARRHVAPLGHIIIEMGLRASSAWRGVRRLCRMYKFKTNLSFGWDVNKTEVPCWEIATLWGNMFLLLLLNAACLVEKQQIPIYILRCDPTDARTHDLHIVLEMKICNYWYTPYFTLSINVSLFFSILIEGHLCCNNVFVSNTVDLTVLTVSTGPPVQDQ